MSDYYTDLKSVLDQAIRVLQAMIDIAAESGWLATTLQLQNLLQMIVQGKWVNQVWSIAKYISVFLLVRLK